MKYAILLVVGIAISSPLIAQERIPVELTKYQIRLGILEPSLMAEYAFSDNQSAVVTAGLSVLPSYEIAGDVTFNEAAFLHPYLRGDIRNYYPRKRVRKDNLRPNSGNYIAVVGGYNFNGIFLSSADDADEDLVSRQEKSWFVGPVWGIQRNYASGIHLGLSLGGGYSNGKNKDGEFWPVGHFSFGFVLK